MFSSSLIALGFLWFVCFPPTFQQPAAWPNQRSHHHSRWQDVVQRRHERTSNTVRSRTIPHLSAQQLQVSTSIFSPENAQHRFCIFTRFAHTMVHAIPAENATAAETSPGPAKVKQHQNHEHEPWQHRSRSLFTSFTRLHREPLPPPLFDGSHKPPWNASATKGGRNPNLGERRSCHVSSCHCTINRSTSQSSSQLWSTLVKFWSIL